MVRGQDLCGGESKTKKVDKSTGEPKRERKKEGKKEEQNKSESVVAGGAGAAVATKFEG